MMAFYAENLDVRGMRLINSPNWNFYVLESKNVNFEDIYIHDVDLVHGEKVNVDAYCVFYSIYWHCCIE